MIILPLQILFLIGFAVLSNLICNLASNLSSVPVHPCSSLPPIQPVHPGLVPLPNSEEGVVITSHDAGPVPASEVLQEEQGGERGGERKQHQRVDRHLDHSYLLYLYIIW